MSVISTLEFLSVALPNRNNLLWRAVPVTDAATANHNGIKTYLANDLSKFLIKDNLAFSNGLKNSPKNHPNSSISFNLKPDFNCSSSFVLSWVDKCTEGI